MRGWVMPVRVASGHINNILLEAGGSGHFRRPVCPASVAPVGAGCMEVWPPYPFYMMQTCIALVQYPRNVIVRHAPEIAHDTNLNHNPRAARPFAQEPFQIVVLGPWFLPSQSGRCVNCDCASLLGFAFADDTVGAGTEMMLSGRNSVSRGHVCQCEDKGCAARRVPSVPCFNEAPPCLVLVPCLSPDNCSPPPLLRDEVPPPSGHAVLQYCPTTGKLGGHAAHHCCSWCRGRGCQQPPSGRTAEHCRSFGEGGGGVAAGGTVRSSPGGLYPSVDPMRFEFRQGLAATVWITPPDCEFKRRLG